MSIVLALLGLLGMAVFFIQGIIFLLQRKKIKNPLILFITSFIIGFIGILLTPTSEGSDEIINNQVNNPVGEVANSESVKENTNSEKENTKEEKEASVSTDNEAEETQKETESLKESTEIENTSDKTDKKEEATTSTSKEYTLKHGELISINEIENTIVIKAKIKPSMSDKLTISQNFYNIADLINEQNADKFDEIQYWAVADMSDGSEQKVISFTVNKDVIKSIINNEVYPNELTNYVSDLWIHSSLK